MTKNRTRLSPLWFCIRYRREITVYIIKNRNNSVEYRRLRGSHCSQRFSSVGRLHCCDRGSRWIPKCRRRSFRRLCVCRCSVPPDRRACRRSFTTRSGTNGTSPTWSCPTGCPGTSDGKSNGPKSTP